MKELVLSGVQIRALPGTQHSKDLGFSFQNAAQCNFLSPMLLAKDSNSNIGESDWLSWAICSGHRVGII